MQKKFDAEKGKIQPANSIGSLPGPIRPVPITPRLMRTVPQNIASVIGNFDEINN